MNFIHLKSLKYYILFGIIIIIIIIIIINWLDNVNWTP